ncbi:MAG: amidohydrolase family protein [Thermoprotei archaeon]|nr:amidohydrolase family protein [Thermoprotei archaeon]
MLITGLAVLNSEGDAIGDSILVYSGFIEGVGPRSRFTGSYSVEVKYDGYIMPGFVDAHLHLEGLGLAIEGIDLRGLDSIEGLRLKLRDVKGPLVYGRGWDQEGFRESRWPSRWDIDDVTGDRPAILVRVCGHAALLNTRALEIVKPWEAYPDFVEVREGKITGIVYEGAVSYSLEKLLENVSLEPIIAGALERLRSAGLVGASTMSCTRREYEVLKRLAAELGALPVKVSCYPDYSKKFSDSGVGEWVSIAGYKIYADGSLGARTAFLREPYSDDPQNKGVLLAGRETIKEAMREAEGEGLKAAIHAIGDAGLDEVISAAEEARPSKFRVEHASVSWDEQIEALARLGAYVVVQPRFRVSDWWIDRRLGPRLKLAYRFKSFLKHEVKLALSSDSPVEPFDINETIASALSKCGQPSCLEEEALDFKEAVTAYTRGAAIASGGPLKLSGLLERGFKADLTVSRSNPFEEFKVEPLGTIVSGFDSATIAKYLKQRYYLE